MFKKFIKITYFLHFLLENLVIDKYIINTVLLLMG